MNDFGLDDDDGPGDDGGPDGSGGPSGGGKPSSGSRRNVYGIVVARRVTGQEPSGPPRVARNIQDGLNVYGTLNVHGGFHVDGEPTGNEGPNSHDGQARKLVVPGDAGPPLTGNTLLPTMASSSPTGLPEPHVPMESPSSRSPPPEGGKLIQISDADSSEGNREPEVREQYHLRPRAQHGGGVTPSLPKASAEAVPWAASVKASREKKPQRRGASSNKRKRSVRDDAVRPGLAVFGA